MMNDTLKAALMSDIHKAMGTSGLVPVKRMIRGKYGVYFAIRWVRPGEEQKGDIPLKKPTPEDYAQADAEATPEKASRLIDSIKSSDPREMRESIAKMLQALGGGHDAHHAILEALEARGVKFESTGNVLTTWSNALEPMMNYIKSRNAQRTQEPEPQPQKEEPQPEPQKEESSSEQQRELKGSEKQIKWATEIRDRMLDTFGKYRDYAKDKNPDEVALIDSLTAAINNATDAKTFINLFKDFRPKGDMEQDVKNLYGYYRTAVKYAATDDEKRLIQPLVDVWNKYKKDKKEEQPQPETEKPAVRNIGGVNFKDEEIFTPTLGQHNRPDDDALRGVIAKYVSRMRGVGDNPVVSAISYRNVDDIAYRSNGIYMATVEYTVSWDGGSKNMKKTLTLPPFGKDAETVSIRGNKFAARLFQENCGRSSIRQINEDDTTNYDALPIERGRLSQFALLPEHIQHQLTTQSVVPLVAKAIATGRGIMSSPEIKQPFVVYNLSFGGYDESDKDANGNPCITIHAECRGENDFETQGQYEILVNTADLHIMDKAEWNKSETAKKLSELSSQMEDLDGTLDEQKKSVARLDAEYRRLQKQEKELGTAQGFAYSQIQSDMRKNRNSREKAQEALNDTQEEYDKLKSEYDRYLNVETPQGELEGQLEVSEDYEPETPQSEPEKPASTEKRKRKTDDEDEKWAKAPQKVKGVYVYRSFEEYEHYARDEDGTPNYEFSDAPGIHYPNENSDRFEIEWSNLKAKSKKEALNKFYKKFSAALRAQIDAGDDPDGVVSEMLDEIESIPDAIKSGDLDIEFKTETAWFECEYVDNDEWYVDYARRHPKEKSAPEPEPEQPQESAEEEQARLKAEDEARKKKIGAKNSYQGLTLNTNAVSRIEEQLSADNQELEELNLLRIKDGEIRLIASVYDSVTGKRFKRPMYLKNGEGRDKVLDTPADAQKNTVSMDSADAVFKRIQSVPNYEDTKNGGMLESAFKQFADSTAKGYEGITPDQARMFRGTSQSLERYARMHRDGTYKEEADKASIPWKGAIQTAKIIEKCELSHDSVARKQFRVNEFAQFFGLNPDDFTEPGERLTADKLSTLRGYSFKSNNFVNAYGSFGNYPSLGDGEIDVEFLLPKGSKAAMVDPFTSYGKVERGNSLTWSGTTDFDKAEFARSSRNSGGLLIQRGSTYQIMKIAEESGGVGQKQYRAYVLVSSQDPWSMEPHGQPPDDWSLDKPIYWEG